MVYDKQQSVRNSLGEAVEDAGHTEHRGVDDPWLLNFEDKQATATYRDWSEAIQGNAVKARDIPNTWKMG